MMTSPKLLGRCMPNNIRTFMCVHRRTLRSVEVRHFFLPTLTLGGCVINRLLVGPPYTSHAQNLFFFSKPKNLNLILSRPILGLGNIQRKVKTLKKIKSTLTIFRPRFCVL